MSVAELAAPASTTFADLPYAQAALEELYPVGMRIRIGSRSRCMPGGVFPFPARSACACVAGCSCRMVRSMHPRICQRRRVFHVCARLAAPISPKRFRIFRTLPSANSVSNCLAASRKKGEWSSSANGGAFLSAACSFAFGTTYTGACRRRRNI